MIVLAPPTGMLAAWTSWTRPRTALLTAVTACSLRGNRCRVVQDRRRLRPVGSWVGLMVSGSSAACQGSVISSERENSLLLLGTVSRHHSGKILDRLLIAAPEFQGARDTVTLVPLHHRGGSTRNFPLLETAVKTRTGKRTREPTWWTVPSISTGMIKSALLIGCWGNREIKKKIN